jgi:hypothetical protein
VFLLLRITETGAGGTVVQIRALGFDSDRKACISSWCEKAHL